MKPKVSLKEFAKSRVKRAAPPGECPVCALPECEEINQAFRGGLSQVAMVEWLNKVQGKPIKRNRMERHVKHLRDGHEKEPS